MSTLGQSTVVATAGAAIAAADILAGRQTFTSTTAATTIITIPAGRTWVGTVAGMCDCTEVAAGTASAQATAVFTTQGTNVTPAAGTYLVIEARTGANAATGLVGDESSTFGSIPFVVIAPAGNSVTIQVASTNVGTSALVEAFAAGILQ